MPVVSNTSPILNLAIVDRLKLLHQQFGQIQIPALVLEELKVDEERPGSQSIQAAIADGWIKVQPVSNQTFVQLLRQTLDGGEAEALALALELQAEEKQSGELQSLQPVIEELNQNAGFRIAPELLTRILEA